MEIKSSIFRRGSKGDKTAKLYDKPWTLRFIFQDETGNQRNKTYQFAKRIDAIDERPRIEADLKTTHGRSAKGEKMTFADLAGHAKSSFYKEAVIVEGRKIDGIRSHGRTMTLVNTLIQFFGKKKLSEITRGDLTAYKSWRISQGDRRGKAADLPAKDRKPVKLSSVNRELATMRHILKNALAEGWITKDVFVGSKAIDKDAETARVRTLTAKEESRLLDACSANGESRRVTYIRNGRPVTASIERENRYLKAITLLALDSAMRRGEILKLRWQDVDFENGIIHVQGTHTKTQKGRITPLTERVTAELVNLTGFAENGNIFPFADFKKSWKTALRLSGIEGLTFHDLRRTAITRMQTRGVPMGIAAEIAGHARLETTQRHYTSIDDIAIVQAVGAKIDAANIETMNEFVN
jgi:integrase